MRINLYICIFISNTHMVVLLYTSVPQTMDVS